MIVAEFARISIVDPKTTLQLKFDGLLGLNFRGRHGVQFFGMPSSFRTLARRGFIFGLAGAGAAACYRYRDYVSYLLRQELPGEPEYREFLAALPLRYITVDEIIRPHRNIRNGVANTLPPRYLWSNLPKTLAVADEIRHRLGAPLDIINSAYRSPAYNAQCPGAAKRSHHLRNRALDLMFRCPSQEAVRVAKELRSEGFFRGGIGLYPSFIHVDTRARNADWGQA